MVYKILIVDDDLEILETLKTLLLRHNYEVVTASAGREALLKVKEENPDVIILDLMLPDLNGFEVLTSIRQNYNDKWRPVIIISAKAELETLKQSYKLEADHCLLKPCMTEDVLNGVRTMISLIPLRIK